MSPEDDYALNPNEYARFKAILAARDAELDVLREELRRAHDILEAITDDEPCSFDHHGGCQDHMFLDLEHEVCPMKLAQDWLADWGGNDEV